MLRRILNQNRQSSGSLTSSIFGFRDRRERLLCPLSCRWRPDWHPCHPGRQSSASMLRHCSSILTASQRHELRLAAGNASNADWLDTWLAIRCGQFRQLGETCGDDCGYRFVGCITVAACSSHLHTRITNAESRIPRLTPTKLAPAKPMGSLLIHLPVLGS